jgi:hypothetical protein
MTKVFLEPVELSERELDQVSGGVANVGLVNADVILNNIANNNDIANNNHVNVAILSIGAQKA